MNNEEILIHVLIDCEATGIAFMDQDIARHHYIPLQEVKKIWQVEVIDRRLIQSDDITHIGEVGMVNQGHQE